jgi:hypothetical protein
VILSTGNERVLVLPDIQAPYHHADTLAFLDYLSDKYQPTRVVCIGDSVDFHRMAKFVPVADSPGPAQEHEQALAFLEQLYKRFPVAHEVASNHNSRYQRKASDSGIPSGFMKPYREILKHPKGWKYSDFVVIDGVMYEHGDRFGGGNATRQAVQVNGQSTVFGHHHAHAGIQYVASRTKLLFAMNVGCLIDHESYGMAYAKVSRLYQTLGAGLVLNGIPLWEPMVLDSKHRWAASLPGKCRAGRRAVNRTDHRTVGKQSRIRPAFSPKRSEVTSRSRERVKPSPRVH